MFERVFHPLPPKKNKKQKKTQSIQLLFTYMLIYIFFSLRIYLIKKSKPLPCQKRQAETPHPNKQNTAFKKKLFAFTLLHRSFLFYYFPLFVDSTAALLASFCFWLWLLFKSCSRLRCNLSSTGRVLCQHFE